MRDIIFLLTLFSFGCSNSQNKIPSEEAVFRIFEKKYNSLRIRIKDSLDKGISNVNDFDRLYTDSEKKQLDSIITDFKKNTSLTIALITFDSLMSSRDSIEDVTRIIGIRHRVNTTVGIYRSYKTMYIWNDSLVNNTFLNQYDTKEIIDSNFIPSFRREHYFKGTLEGLQNIIRTIKRERKNREFLKNNGG